MNKIIPLLLRSNSGTISFEILIHGSLILVLSLCAHILIGIKFNFMIYDSLLQTLEDSSVSFAGVSTWRAGRASSCLCLSVRSGQDKALRKGFFINTQLC